MHDQPIQLPWTQPDWLEHVSAWIEAQIHERGWSITEPLTVVHQRPWSAFARQATSHGVVYFKAPAPVYDFEAPLTRALAEWRPDCMVPLLAVDLKQGWILSADAGITLRQIGQTIDQIDHWVKVLPLYSELQICLVDRVPEMLALGLPDRRLAELPRLYAQLLEANKSLRVGRDPGLTMEEYQRLRDLQPRFVAECAELAAYGLPETITHEEIHENNVLFSNGHYILTDWSDSSVSHPFFSMLVTLRATAHWLKLDEHGPDIQKLRDAYLEPWTTFAPRSRLDRALELAYRIGMVNRALSWHHGMGRLSEHDNEQYADSVPGWLQDFLVAEAEASNADGS